MTPTVLARRAGFALLAAAFLSVVQPASARFIRVEVEKVPVERLAENLRTEATKNPKDATAALNLARVYAMAYSLKADELPTQKGKPDAGVWFGYTPKRVPFGEPVPAGDEETWTAAQSHLENATKWYTVALERDPKNLTARLGHGWVLEQAGKTGKAIAAYREVIEQAWKTEQNLRTLGLGGHTYTAEAAGYLIPLLDPEKDKAEVATLKERTAKLGELPRPVTPIAVPLKDGLAARDLEDRAAAVAFDADGSGLQKRWTWVTSDAAWLVHDPAGAGTVTSGLQLFGNVTFWLFWETGYDALAALDDDRDGRLANGELHGLALWHDANGNGVSDAGEVKPLAEYGIVVLSCRSERDAAHPDRIAYSPAGVTFGNGTTRPTFDLVLHAK